MTVIEETHRPIQAIDRCDSCNAIAKVRATLTTGELYFCGHHAREIGYKLVLQSISVFDPEGVFNYGQQSRN